MQKHTVKSFDDDLNEMRSIISEMGARADTAIRDAVDALIRQDTEAAEKVIKDDDILDDLEREADRKSVEILARRSPLADDLRELVAALKISNILERIGDYAKNIAKRTASTRSLEGIRPVSTLPLMAEKSRMMVRDVVDAFLNHDADKAMEVWEYDRHVDELNNTIFRELLTYMMENPRLITPCTHLLFISKNVERVGDHATNIAEIVYFSVKGEILEKERKKAGETEYFDPLKDKGK